LECVAQNFRKKFFCQNTVTKGSPLLFLRSQMPSLRVQNSHFMPKSESRERKCSKKREAKANPIPLVPGGRFPFKNLGISIVLVFVGRPRGKGIWDCKTALSRGLFSRCLYFWVIHNSAKSPFIVVR
jgi:hypothetical protein